MRDFCVYSPTMSAADPPPSLYLCGPTASGKTAAAISLARDLNGEIVNADAYQIYRGIDTLSAAPDKEELAAAPHHLYGVLDPTQTCDAMRYREMALPIIRDIQSRGKIPIISGGSGLYLKFLTHGPSPVPPSCPDVRAQLENRSDEDLIAEFRALDPDGAAITNLTNRRYVIRALEICLLSGLPMSEIKADWQKHATELSRGLTGLCLTWPREQLYERINRRTTSLVCDQAIAEVMALQDDASITCRKAIGFADLLRLGQGTLTPAEAVESIATATRRYAKRQTSWFRRESWLTAISCPTDRQTLVDEAKKVINAP